VTTEPDPPALPPSIQRLFTARRGCVRSAREFAAATVRAWGLSDAVDDARLCVSELASNALAYGTRRGHGFLVRLVHEGDLVRVEVHDSRDRAEDSAPVVCHPSATDYGVGGCSSCKRWPTAGESKSVSRSGRWSGRSSRTAEPNRGRYGTRPSGDGTGRTRPAGRLLLDVGGYFAPVLTALPGRFTGRLAGVVEDTENGHRRYESLDKPPCPVVPVARSPVKGPRTSSSGSPWSSPTEAVMRGRSGTRRDGLNVRGRRTAGRPRGSGGRAPGAVAVSLAEHPHLGIGVVDVDGDLVELIDELLKVLRLELGEVDRHP
jgi:hypothetical protein